MAHVGNELALGLVGGVGLLLCGLKLRLPFFQLGNVREHSNRPAIWRPALTDLHPTTVCVSLLEEALGSAMSLEPLLEPFLGRQAVQLGDAAVEKNSQHVLKPLTALHDPGIHSLVTAGSNIEAVLVVKNGKALRDCFDGRLYH